MRIVVGTYLLIHGFCHLVGFIVPWKIATMKEEPYKTTIIAGAFDIGDTGIRIVGVLWLLTAIAYAAGGVGVFAGTPWWRSLTLLVTLFSLLLCIGGLPGAKIGILANAIILVFLAADSKWGWLSA